MKRYNPGKHLIIFTRKFKIGNGLKHILNVLLNINQIKLLDSFESNVIFFGLNLSIFR